MTWSLIVFVASFVTLTYFLRGAIRVYRSPEYQTEVKVLRAQRRARKMARRS